ncbi:MAG: thioredoxin [Aeromicrobium sp.]|nr:MAG: thioredoxin [Aeromicrobium sp.]
MSTVEITLDNLEQTVNDNDIVLLDFWAAWCGPCRSFAPVFEQAATTHTDVVFGKIDTEAEQQLAAGFGISSIPTLMAFREGIIVFAQPGALNSAQLEQVVAGVKALDMDEVRAQIEADKTPASAPAS